MGTLLGTGGGLATRTGDSVDKVAGKPKNKARRVVLIVLAAILAGGLGLGSWVLVSAQRAIDTATQGQGGSVIDVLVPQPVKADTTATPGSGGALNDAERLNVLVAGSSADDPGHGGGRNSPTRSSWPA